MPEPKTTESAVLEALRTSPGGLTPYAAAKLTGYTSGACQLVLTRLLKSGAVTRRRQLTGHVRPWPALVYSCVEVARA